MSERSRNVPEGAAALAKGLSLLDLVADADAPLRFAELLKLSGLPKPTFARILRTLIAFDLVQHSEDKGTYSLGRRFMELSHKVWDNFDLQAASAPEMDKLARDLGESVALARLDRGQVHYIDERSGAGLSVKVEIGQHSPLHSTAAGKALLAFHDPSDQRRLLGASPLEAYTPATLTSQEAVLADLALTRARGYALSFEEHLPGVNSVAVAISGQDGTPIGALSVLAPAARMDDGSIHPVGRDLMAAARRITGSAGAVAISSRPQPRQSGSDTAREARCILPWGAQLGEAPMWHPEEHRLYWVDILKPAIYRYDIATGHNEICEVGKLVSAVLPRAGGGVMVASQDGIEAVDFDTGAFTPFCDPGAGQFHNRLNDAKIGVGGAIWVGSMRLDASRPTGGLFRVTADGAFEQKESGITVSNGLGWSPDGGTFYFVDTVPGLIYAYDSAPGTGELRDRRVFATIPKDEGRPGGLCVDADGGVWCAIWDGWKVVRFDPGGRLSDEVKLPVPRPTSLCFAGDGGRDLIITTARTRLPAKTLADAPLSGGLFAADVGVAGLPSEIFTPGPGDA